MNSLAYSYIRWSSTMQSSGDSHRRQLAKFQDYCKRKGLTPAEDRFIDRGRSGFKKEHLNDTGELRRFLNAVEGGDIAPGSALVVESLDRLGRQEVEEALGVFMLILNAGTRAADAASVVAWRREHGASIAATAEEFGISTATVKRYCAEQAAIRA